MKIGHIFNEVQSNDKKSLVPSKKVWVKLHLNFLKPRIDQSKV